MGEEKMRYTGYTPGIQNCAVTKPLSLITRANAKHEAKADEMLQYYPETIKAVREKGTEYFIIDVVYLKYSAIVYEVRFNDIVFSAFQLKELKETGRRNSVYDEAVRLYPDIEIIVGHGNYALTKASRIALDQDIRKEVFHPKQIIIYDEDSIRLESDGEIEFYTVAARYVNIPSSGFYTELDKVRLSQGQLGKLFKKNFAAVQWYFSREKKSSSNSFVKEELIKED